MGLTAGEIAKSLGDAHRLGDGGWKCRCPAHNDDKGSLSITDGKEGKILFRCHAGCDQKQVLDALQSAGLWSRTSDKKDKRRPASWEPVLPVPEGVGPPSKEKTTHFRHGEPTRKWIYRDTDGHVVGYIFRFEETNPTTGKVTKTTLPMCYCRSDAGQFDWAWKSFAKPRPLYNLQLLAQRPKAPVAVFEGEKSADAASKLFPDYVCVAWPGGTKAVKYVDFKPLVGRDVTLWPDADQVGREAMNHAGEILFVEGATRIRMVAVPDWVDVYVNDEGKDVGKGWDVADDPLPGLDDLELMLRQARPFSPEGGDIIAELNKRFAFVLLGGKGAILRETPNEAEGRVDVDYLSVEGFGQFYSNSKVPVGRNFMPAGKFWMTHEERRTYEGITFSPGRKTPGYYNLWRGFSVAPDPTGDWSMLREHLYQNAASDNEEHFRWIFGWFAQIFQHPANKNSTSLSFRGKQGTGKTLIGKVFGHLLRGHYTLVEDSRYLFSNFNSHMASSVLLHSDESFWGGDPRNIGKLKAMVSGDTHRIEYKTRDTIEIPNYMRLLITTNNDWVVPAAAEERRFAVFDMGDGNMQDNDYFVEMLRQLRDGGYAGLLHALLTFDLSSTNIHKIPDTKALRDQKATSMSDVAKFWIYCLTEGDVMPGHNVGWPATISSHRLYECGMEMLQKWGSRYKPAPTEFAKEIKALAPDGTMGDIKLDHGTRKQWGYELPDLDKARSFLDEKFGTNFPWKVERAIKAKDAEVDLDMPF